MNDKKYKSLLKKIDFLMKLKRRIPRYVLQGSPVHDMSVREYEWYVNRNKKNDLKRYKYNLIIADILITIKNSGYSIDEFFDKYEYDRYDYWDIEGILNCKSELLEYYEARGNKHSK